jgi:hypothetical protein
MNTRSALSYKNRRGEVFYLQEGKTPTGKPKYYAGKELTGAAMAAMPEGYEFYERPDHGQVVVRKIKAPAVTEAERKLVEEILRRARDRQNHVVEIDGESIVVHMSRFGVGEQRVSACSKAVYVTGLGLMMVCK